MSYALNSHTDHAHFIRDRLPPGGLFAGQDWRVSPVPFALGPELAKEIESLGRVLLQFNRAVNLLYRQSVAGRQPAWIAGWLDRGKPQELIELQRAPEFKNDLPRVIRPDILLTESGLSITELDSVPGGIGLTAWLNQTYSLLASNAATGRKAAAGASVDAGSPSDPSADLGPAPSADYTPMPSVRPPITNHPSPIANHPSPITNRQSPIANHESPILGGAEGMLRGFAAIFGDAARVHIVVSDESAAYRPEMEWLCQQLGGARFQVRNTKFIEFAEGEAVFRFFELFDLANVENARSIFDLALAKRIRLTPPPKPVFEEKMLLALLWNRNLRGFWRQELGESFYERLLKLVPYTWVIDPSPLPPHTAIPELNLTDWHQLKTLSQRDRDLILKVSGYSEAAWGARGVYLGSDLSLAEWSAAVDAALAGFERSPRVLQRYHKPKVVQASWFDFDQNTFVSMSGRVRLCPYYFVAGDGDAARAQLGGVLATICPAEKKIIHGMEEAILAPCTR
ncbi:MAG: hypothetical protein HY674_12990 [Chloroflexi bacterium]|nr:hypothetical protein [Chloroflexota bacterium]